MKLVLCSKVGQRIGMMVEVYYDCLLLYVEFTTLCITRFPLDATGVGSVDNPFLSHNTVSR